MRSAVTHAISLGSQLYNSGSHAACAELYAATALELMLMSSGSSASAGADSFSALSALQLTEALSASFPSASERAWALRHAFDRALGDADFVCRLEAPLPAGFPSPGPLGALLEKTYPPCRAARASGSGAFGSLFRHISSSGISMTSPVLSTLGEGGEGRLDMHFFHEVPSQSPPPGPRGGGVEVLDLPALRVLSLCVRGEAEGPLLRLAQRCLEAGLQERGLRRAGGLRLLGYSSPMVPVGMRLFELQARLEE